MSTALARVDTGEVVNAPAPFDLATYIADIKAPRHAEQQKALMVAYDAACAALIGPNDVQVDQGRSFKKKSAWRKLARHFGISVASSLDSVKMERYEGGFTAYAAANAVAPWGQSWTDIGACSSDEATGRRVITIADAIATAMTRASNRAVSNLIAMGEVSAEEIGERGSPARQQARTASAVTFGPDSRLDFGKHSGTAVRDLSIEYLSWAVEDGRRLGPHTAAWQAAFNAELDRRELNTDDSDDEGHDNVG